MQSSALRAQCNETLFQKLFFVARHRLLVAQATPLSRLVASSPSAIRSRVLIMLFRAFEEKIVSSLYTFFFRSLVVIIVANDKKNVQKYILSLMLN